MWDLFISHASEDKDSIARPLFEALGKRGYKVWFDEHTLKLGDSLRQKIDDGLANSRFGVVVLSHSFFNKQWPQSELDALISQESSRGKVVLPIWHNLEFSDVASYSPILAGKLSAKSSLGIEKLVLKISESIGPSVFTQKTQVIENAPSFDFKIEFEKPNLDHYISACMEELLLEDFCKDIVSIGDFKISTVKLLREGEVPNDKLNAILSSLVDVAVKKHRKSLLQLICLLFDFVEVDPELLKKLYRAGIDSSVYLSISAYVPNKASNYLCRIFFDAYHACEVDPIRFDSSLNSQAFRRFCTKFEKERTLQIVKSWEDGRHGSFTGATVIDSVGCVIKLVDGSDNENDSREFKFFLKHWREKGILDEHLGMHEGGMGDDVRRILGW